MEERFPPSQVNIPSQQTDRSFVIDSQRVDFHAGFNGTSIPKSVISRPQLSSSSVSIPKNITHATTSKSTNNLLDRPSHWVANSAKVSKPMSASRKSATKELMKPRTAPTPRPLKTTPLAFGNPSNQRNLSFQPSWMSQTIKNPSSRFATQTRDRDDEVVEEAEEQHIEATRVPSTSIGANSTGEHHSLHHKSKTRSTTAKPGSSRWLLAKLIRENDSLNTWISNHHPDNNLSSLSLHDPRNRVELMIEIEVFRNHGYYNPFLVLTGLMVGYKSKPPSSHKRKIATDSYTESYQEQSEEEIEVDQLPSLPATCIIFNSHAEAQAKKNLEVTPNKLWKLYNPVCTRIQPDSDVSQLSPVVQKVLIEFQQPIEYLVLTHSPVEKLFTT